MRAVPLIVDAHEDLAWNALTFGRDYTRPAHATRQIEESTPIPSQNGNTLLGLNEYLLGHVAVVFGTLFASPARRKLGDWDTLTYADAKQAHKLYARQMDFYHQLVDEHEQFTLIGDRRDLESVLESWKDSRGLDSRRIGIVPLMEGADGIQEPEQAEGWMERGVRIVGLAWAATRYAGGTGEPGPLTADGRRLLDVMSGLGLILDLSHASDESFLEALDRFEGTVISSHANPRALWKEETQRPERALSDDMIRRLAERGGVTGIVPFNRFLKADWRSPDGKQAVGLERVAAMVDYVCQITGSADHVGIGSDFDGGFGVESAPAEIDTVADLSLIGALLKDRGYESSDVGKIMRGNWLRILRQGLPA
jgi:membrane dipeptidase